MRQVEGSAWRVIIVYGFRKWWGMCQQEHVSVASQSKWQNPTDKLCGFLAQFLHLKQGLVPGEASKVNDSAMVWTSDTGTGAKSRAGVRPAVMPDEAGIAIERDDLPAVEVMEILNLGADAVDVGSHLGHRTAVVIMIAGDKIGGPWTAGRRNHAKVSR